jgi:hypothetical protein
MTFHPLLKKKGLAAIILAGIIVMVWILWKNDPSKTLFFPPCLFYKVTSFYCPGCGSTRACHALLNGNLSHAISMNPLLVLSIPVVIFMLIFPASTHIKYAPHFAVIILLAYWVARNIPEFSWLAPS